MKAQTVSLIGLNRITVSLGLALKNGPLDMQVIGYDADTAVMQQAKEELKAIDKAEWNLLNAATKADILILNLPQPELEMALKLIGGDVQPHVLLLDMSSLKSRGLSLAQKYLQRGHYVGVQPVLSALHMGDGGPGLSAARADLFKDSVFCLMPDANVDPKAVETAVNFGRIVGAAPYFLDPIEYDNLLQGIDTMPGLLAAAMFSTLQKATGWRDILRFADLPVVLATASLESASETAVLALNDTAATLRWLDSLVAELQDFRRLIQQKDQESLQAILEELQIKRGKWLRDRAKNDWVEIDAHDVKARGLTEQMLGGWVIRQFKDDD